jgi:hypothetical protein
LHNGARVAYLPPADVYGQGIYQESIAVLAPGWLEHLVDEVGEQIQAWRKDSGRDRSAATLRANLVAGRSAFCNNGGRTRLGERGEG